MCTELTNRNLRFDDDTTWLKLLFATVGSFATAVLVDENAFKARLARTGEAGARALVEYTMELPVAQGENAGNGTAAEWPTLNETRVRVLLRVFVRVFC